MSLAAAFGPVERLSTTINFTDLLGLQTAPAQVANVGVIRTGIDVFDGLIRYQLLPGLRVRVESGRWPVRGRRAAAWRRRSSTSATRRPSGSSSGSSASMPRASSSRWNSATSPPPAPFDGIIPMEFDQGGGPDRWGVSSSPGRKAGTLPYIGEPHRTCKLGSMECSLSSALKSLRYNKLTIVLNGALDGEFVAGIELTGSPEIRS
jgi:hypothetical protein